MQTVLVVAIILALSIFIGTFAMSIIKGIIDIKKKKRKEKLNTEVKDE